MPEEAGHLRGVIGVCLAKKEEVGIHERPGRHRLVSNMRIPGEAERKIRNKDISRVNFRGRGGWDERARELARKFRTP